MKKATLYTLLICLSTVSAWCQDWPNLKYYQQDNQKVQDSGTVVKAVFMGDSITDFWINNDPVFFMENKYTDRGISGQTSPQMLLRFRQDVIDLKPKTVILLCGTNDIAGNTGFATLKMTEDNIQSMAELAQANHIQILLCTVLPANRFYWNPQIQPADSIIALNAWIKAYAQMNQLVYVDYYSVLTDENKGMKKEYSEDGVHPNKAGYAVMKKILQPSINK